MRGFHANIEEETLANDNFRKVLYTGKNSQLVLMSLRAGEDIGVEVHSENDQFFRFESGTGQVMIDDTVYAVEVESAIVVPAGARHNVINMSESDALKFYTIYSPAHHKEGTIHATKADAEAAEERGDEEFDGVTTE